MLAAPLAATSTMAAAPPATVMPKALFYDVFSTLMDWRTGVAREAERLLKPITADWLKFADTWRSFYQPSMEEIRSGRRQFVKLDVLHREMLDRTLAQFNVKDAPDELADLNLAWHRLDAWPDVQRGFMRLGAKFLMAPCSNGNIALMADLARRNELRWDAILGSDIARDYKPKPNVFSPPVDAFNLTPGECMMVAAHSDDLHSAAAQGLRTAHVARRNEYGPNTGESGPKQRVTRPPAWKTSPPNSAREDYGFANTCVQTCRPTPEGGQSLTPYLIVKNAAKAIQFYKNAFDATERYRLTEPSAKIGQAHTRPSRLISVHGHSITVS